MSTNLEQVKNATETRNAVLAAIPAYLSAMEADYKQWGGGPDDQKFDIDMGGKRYVRIWHTSGGGRSAHSFIVMEDCTVNTVTKKQLQLKAGDILKVATWKAPALNFVRGNVLTGDYGKCCWTGAA